MIYLYVCTWIIAADPGLLGLCERYEDESCQGYHGVITTETTLEEEKDVFIKILRRK